MAGLFGTPEESQAIGSLCKSLPAEIEVDPIPDLLGEMERLWAGLCRCDTSDQCPWRPLPHGPGWGHRRSASERRDLSAALPGQVQVPGTTIPRAGGIIEQVLIHLSVEPAIPFCLFLGPELPSNEVILSEVLP